ncbi:MAG: cellulose synthase catalytic subunit (UDP-forming) [Hydrogenothermus sp.]|nr:MAG: cellulose synthase catalytic subunit (UDP-forming) [Hydrogenothermus sp.]
MIFLDSGILKENKEKLAKIFVVFLFSVYGLFIIAQTSTLNQLIISLLLVGVILFLFKKKTEYVKLIIILTGIFITLRYFYWRTFNTINTDNPINFMLSFLLYFAEFYSILIALLGGFIALRLLERKEVPITLEDKEKLPTVDIFIPTYNEPVDVVKITALAATALDYPKEKFKVYILDDGGTKQKLNDPDIKKREENRKRAQALKDFVKSVGGNLYYLTREKNEHAKAGNINEALKKTKGDLILILDCDHIPTQDFLRNTVGFFLKYPKLFLVQTPHSFQNPDPIEKNLEIFRKIPTENDMFYKFIQKGLDFWSSSFFCGSAAVLRRKYLEEIGGIQGQTITEDAETALELHSRGLDSAYYGKKMVYGLQPETFASFIVQRSRWAQGMVQIFLLKNPLFKRGLKWYQKISYINSSFFWFFGIARAIFLLAPVFFLFFGAKIYDASLDEVLAYAVPHFIASVFVANYLYARVRWNFFSELYEALQSLFILPAILSVLLNPRKPTFKVTPKGENLEEEFLSPFYKPIYILFNITLISFFFAIYRWIEYPDERGTIVVVLFWQTFNFLVLALGVIAMREKPERRRAYRIPAQDKVFVYVGSLTFSGRIKDVSLTGIWVETDQDLTHYLDKVRDANVKFLIKDIRGLTFSVEGKVVNANVKNIRATFVNTEDINFFRKLVEVVYAQSTKWEYFIPEKEASPFESLVFLTKLAVSNFTEAYKKATIEFIKEIRQFVFQKLGGKVWDFLRKELKRI